MTADQLPLFAAPPVERAHDGIPLHGDTREEPEGMAAAYPGVPSPVSPPYVKHSKTSQAAAEAIKPHLGRLEAQVYRYIRAKGEWGSTDEEGILLTALAGNTYRPRRIRLAELGYIETVGKRPTRSGRQAEVWAARKSNKEAAGDGSSGSK